MTRAIRLTDEEIRVLEQALTIAGEDGSIYPTEMDEAKQPESDRKRTALIEGIRRKLCIT